MNKVYACIGIFLSLAASRFIPHPPNFTSLLALSFYVPVLFGLRYIPVLLISFAITDLVIGYNSGTHWTCIVAAFPTCVLGCFCSEAQFVKGANYLTRFNTI